MITLMELPLALKTHRSSSKHSKCHNLLDGGNNLRANLGNIPWLQDRVDIHRLPMQQLQENPKISFQNLNRNNEIILSDFANHEL